MTLNNFIEAIAGKLAGVWPDRKVYVDEIPKDADGQFFVGIIESGQEAHLDRRRKRSIQIEVLYFLKSKENMEFNAWAEEMYDQFETLTVKETDQKTRTIRLTNQRARPDKNARVYQFTFDADFFFVLTPAEIPFINRMIRRWFPKGTDFGQVPKKAIQAVEDWLNAYPREILGFRSADEVFAEGLAALG